MIRPYQVKGWTEKPQSDEQSWSTPNSTAVFLRESRSRVAHNLNIYTAIAEKDAAEIIEKFTWPKGQK